MAGAASRYARAIFELASEEGRIDAWSRQLGVLRAVLEHPAARAVLEDPSVTGSRRREAVAALKLEGIGPQGMNLMQMLVDARRPQLIGLIADQFETLADAAAGRVRATVTTAIPLSEPERARLAKDLSAGIGKDVRLVAMVDPKILGGLVLQVGDRLTDASVAGRLAQLRRRVLVK
ncbi:MAG: ATP synthase F1 subunit delta [Candidatus Dormibacteraceae bacterium]